MDKRTIIKFVIQVLLYAIGLVGTWFGVSALSSCTYSRSTVGDGRATIITTDTTYIKHQGILKTK